MVIRVLLLTLLGLAVACGGSSSSQPQPQKPGRVVTSDSAIEILDPVSFAGEADLAPTSNPILDSIAATLDGNPSIKVVEVQVQVADADAPDPAGRQQLADRRAQAVVAYLVGKGVAAGRLRAKGLATPPADPKNVVSFLILERS